MHARIGFIVLVWALCATLVVVWNAQAHAQRGGGRYPASVLCHGMAEDTAAHVRLVEYHTSADGTPHIVYRCKRHGY